MGGGGHQRVNPRVECGFLDVRQQRLHLGQREVERFPQLHRLGRRAAGQLAFDLLAGLERRLLVGFRVAQPVVRVAAGDDRHPHAPVPGGAQRDDLLLDGRRVERAAPPLGLRPLVHVALQVGQRQFPDGKSLPEFAGQVLEVAIDAADAA